MELNTAEWKLHSGKKFYYDEKNIHKSAYEKKLKGWREAEIIARKIAKHYKLPLCTISWTSGRNRPKAFSTGIILNSSYNNGGVLCHELAHMLQRKKLGYSRHNRKMMGLMGRIVKYCEKKNWWSNEIERRLAPKIPKPLPTKAEVRQVKILRAAEKMVRYERKVKFYAKKLSRVKRSLIMLKKNAVVGT